MPQSFDFKILAKLRKKKRLTIEKLAQAAGISYSAVADIERNKVTPNLETLNKIATVLEYRTSDVLSMVEGKHAEVIKTGEYVKVNGFNMSVFNLPGLRFIEAYAAEAYSSDGKLNAHPNFTEVLYVIEGLCKIVIGETEYILKRGEIIKFEGFQLHYYEAQEDNTRLILLHLNK